MPTYPTDRPQALNSSRCNYLRFAPRPRRSTMPPATNSEKLALATSGQDSPFAFVLALFRFKGTVFQAIWLKVLCATLVSIGVATCYNYGYAISSRQLFAGNAALGSHAPYSVTFFAVQCATSSRMSHDSVLLSQLPSLLCLLFFGTMCHTHVTMKHGLPSRKSAPAFARSPRWCTTRHRWTGRMSDQQQPDQNFKICAHCCW